MIRILAAVCAIAAAAVGPSSAGGRDLIPFAVTEDGHIVLDVSVNDGPVASAMLDTGANYAMIGAPTLEAAGVATPEAPTYVNVLGVGGFQTFPSMAIPSMRIADLTFENVPAAIEWQEGGLASDGAIIPAIAFQHEVLDLDFERGRMTLYNGRPLSARGRTAKLQATQRSGLWFIPVEINNRTGLALLDTGANVSYLNSAFAEAAAVKDQTPPTLDLEGAVEGPIKARIVRVRRMAAGRHHLSRFNIAVADPPLFEHLGMGDEPAMVLGVDFLRHFRVQLDRGSGEVRLTR